MKPPTVFLGEMTSPEVEAFLVDHDTVIVPTGSTEQHGPHGPLLTDVLVPQEVARRVAPRVGAVVAPPINYGLSYPHVGFTGLVHIRIPTFMALVEDLCASLSSIGFRRIAFLNGHYDNTYAIAYACANAADRLAARDARLPGQLLGRDDGGRGGRVLRADHRPAREPRRDVRGDGDQPGPRRPRQRQRRDAAVPRGHEPGAGPHGVLLLVARARCTARRIRGRGATPASRAPSTASATSQVATEATLRMLGDIDRTFAAMPDR